MYIRRMPNTTLPLHLVALADACHGEKSSQICYFKGIIICENTNGSVFHLISWPLFKSKRPARFTVSAETLVVRVAINEIKLLMDSICFF